jgi:hypothetical protein
MSLNRKIEEKLHVQPDKGMVFNNKVQLLKMAFNEIEHRENKDLFLKARQK